MMLNTHKIQDGDEMKFQTHNLSNIILMRQRIIELKQNASNYSFLGEIPKTVDQVSTLQKLADF